MSLNALQGFVRIVELDSFSEAADALFLSQSALSQQIRALEAQLKVQLFQHAQRRVVLTPAGWEFYPKAKQLLELYDDAVNCAQAAELNANPPKRHLLIGHQNMPLQMLGFDLFAVTEELSTRFSPLMYSCANRKDIGRALLNGEIDLSLQIECAEIAARGLHFYPAVYMPEIGIPFHTPPEVPRGHIPLEQAVKYRWMFAGTPEQSLYETALLHEASRRRAEIIRGVKSVQYKLPSLMLTPAVYYRRPNLEQVFVLDWNKGMRFGIVTKAEPDPVVEEYVRQLQHLLPGTTLPVKRQIRRGRSPAGFAKSKIIFPLKMPRATRRAFQIVGRTPDFQQGAQNKWKTFRLPSWTGSTKTAAACPSGRTPPPTMCGSAR